MIWEEEKSDIVAKFPAFNGRLLNLFFPPANFRIANKLRISRITTKFEVGISFYLVSRDSSILENIFNWSEVGPSEIL